MNEFQLIKQYFTKQSARSDVLLGIGDDCALLHVPEGQSLAVSIDTSVAGVHFPLNTLPYAIGYKSLAVSLSDLAAMGAEPAWATLSLTLPVVNETWLSEFASGFFDLAKQYNVALIGGDTTRGPLSITTQVHGFVPKDKALRRSGAKPGDRIFVTGHLGDAGMGLKVALGEIQLPEKEAKYFLDKLNLPHPRVEIGLALRGIASAALDISDGLASDLAHLLSASQVGADIWLDKLPISTSLAKNLSQDKSIELAYTAGDDYELCFTISPNNINDLEKATKKHDIIVTEIGVIGTPLGLKTFLNDHESAAYRNKGFKHF